jgi:hypothetical protein
MTLNASGIVGIDANNLTPTDFVLSLSGDLAPGNVISILAAPF